MFDNLSPIHIVAFLSLSGIILRSSLSLIGQNWVRTYSFLGTFILLPNIAYIITTVIAGDIALSLGMIGALSIVRFRHPVRSNFELTMYFALITLGIAAGVSIKLAFLLLLVVLATILGIEILQLLMKYFNYQLYQLSFNEGINKSFSCFKIVLNSLAYSILLLSSGLKLEASKNFSFASFKYFIAFSPFSIACAIVVSDH